MIGSKKKSPALTQAQRGIMDRMLAGDRLIQTWGRYEQEHYTGRVTTPSCENLKRLGYITVEVIEPATVVWGIKKIYKVTDAGKKALSNE